MHNVILVLILTSLLLTLNLLLSTNNFIDVLSKLLHEYIQCMKKLATDLHYNYIFMNIGFLQGKNC